jgi:GTPase SAR1 family protein
MTKEKLLKIIKQATKDGVTTLDLSEKGLTELPPEIGQLSNLTELDLSYNQLTALPPTIAQLTNLLVLNLSGNQLTGLPSEISQLIHLKKLMLGDVFGGNQFTSLPPAISQLNNLTVLGLGGNQLTELPPTIEKLNHLTMLDIRWNQLTTLPPEIGHLTHLKELYLDGNPLISPPPEIVAQGTQAILAYFQARLQESQKRWVSKLIVLGEGGVGKTSLLRTLRGEAFNPEESTTHGIEISTLELAHPSKMGVNMQLNSWDFGGQEIYHATHQFFLTNRSLFLLAWNARVGFEQGKLYYWLDTLQALAPDSPVLLVATHIDEREANLPLSELRHRYPQIIGQCEISNKTSQGFEALRQTLAEAAAKLPLMGEIWPSTWLKAANAIRARAEKYITPQVLQNLMSTQGVEDNKQPILTQWLHELGDILSFQENQELADIVILKPQWVSEYISLVLESEDVIKQGGIFTRSEMNQLWQDLDPAMREYFLRLMERFDLSYRDESREISLVVERLPFEAPNYQPKWDSLKAMDTNKEITMRFKLNTLPAGIPTWFMARAHRFSTGTHWRNGALFAYEKHLALVQANPRDCLVQLTVRGPNPQNFFALLKDGIEVTLARFPGLKIERKIPCLGHDEQPCTHEFNYEQLLKRYEKQRLIVECPEELEDVSVTELLYGWDWRTQNLVLSRLDKLEANLGKGQEKILVGQEKILSELGELRELTQREFTQAFRREQASIDVHCPNVFVLRGKGERSKGGWFKAIAGQTFELQLYCQAPGCWHPTQEGGLYEIDEPAQWLKEIAPYLTKLVGVLRYAVPLIGPWLANINPREYEELFRQDIELMKELVDNLPVHQNADNLASMEPERIQGAALRVLRYLLDKKDPQQQWGGLKKVLTPEGHYLWLCDYHARGYQA